MKKVKILLISFLLVLIFISVTSVSAIVFSDTVTEYFPITWNCSGESCNLGCSTDIDCGENYYDNETYYCKDNAVYWKRTFHKQGCNNGACYSITSFQEQLVEVCAYGCENGECIEPEEPPTPEEPECCDDSDCQEDYYSENYCQDNKVYHDLYNFSCFNGKGVKNITQELVQECSDLCLNGECVNIFCKKNNDCGTDGFVGEKYCQDNKIYQDYKYFTCKNPGIINSSCSSSTAPKLIKECDYACENGKCITEEEEEEEEQERNINEVEKINYCGDYFCDKEIGENEFNCEEDCKASVFKLKTEKTDVEATTEAVKLGKGIKFIEEKSNSSLIFISLLVLTVILFIITVLVLIVRG